jgi:hypothetical protein
MERCSCCNARLNGALSCPRCQADLTDVISSEQRAQQLLEQAMQLWFGHEPKLAIQSLSKALPYKKTSASLIFRDFILRQSCSKVVTLLAQGNYLQALQTLALLAELHPTHQLVRQLTGFSQYLLSRQDSPVKEAFKNKPFMISFNSRVRLNPPPLQQAENVHESFTPHPDPSVKPTSDNPLDNIITPQQTHHQDETQINFKINTIFTKIRKIFN